MRRREFITLLGGAAAAWPLAARAQRPARMQRIGVLAIGTEGDPTSQRFVSGLREGLAKLGWKEGPELRIDVRFFGDSPDRMRAYASELVSPAPDVIVALSAAATKELQRQTRTIPIVFLNVGDPGNNGIVKDLGRPEGNATGFTNLFASIAGKCVELLKDAAPRVARIALIFNPEIYAFNDYLAEIEKAAASAVISIRTPVRNAAEIESAIGAFAAEPNGALFIVPPPLTFSNRQLLIRLAIQHRLPSIYPGKSLAEEGGLVSYGADPEDAFRGVSSYVDRILRGAKVGDLAVQFPTRFELIVNLKTAKAIGLTISDSFLLRADNVIE